VIEQVLLSSEASESPEGFHLLARGFSVGGQRHSGVGSRKKVLSVRDSSSDLERNDLACLDI